MDSTLEAAIDAIAEAMGDEIKRRAVLLVNHLTDSEREQFIDYTKLMRTAKVLCLAAMDTKETDILYREFGAESITKEVKSLRKIRNQQR